MTVLLDARDIRVVYSGVVAVDDVSLQADVGELVGLIGPNGAGKTSLIDALTGFTASTGEIFLAGQRLSGLPPHRRTERGMTRTFQNTELFDDLTVLENLLVAAEHPRWWQPVVDLVRPRPHRLHSKVDRVADMLGIGPFLDKMSSDLSLGQQKLVGIARALVTEPKLLLLDEPAAGLDSSETARLGEVLRQIVGDGTGMLLIDHDMSLMLTVCDRLYAIDFGRLIASGTVDEVRHHPQVLAAYLGVGGSTPTVEDVVDAAASSEGHQR